MPEFKLQFHPAWIPELAQRAVVGSTLAAASSSEVREPAIASASASRFHSS